MKQHIKLTQKSLLFGIYFAAKGSLNPGLSVWWKNRYVYPRHRKSIKSPKEATLFQVLEPEDGGSAAALAKMSQ